MAKNKHGTQYIRRIWNKLHIVVGDNGIIVANSISFMSMMTGHKLIY
ncbi:MAG: hypothetical protein AB8B66_05165 [Rickettsiaceae bacterium]